MADRGDDGEQAKMSLMRFKSITLKEESSMWTTVSGTILMNVGRHIVTMAAGLESIGPLPPKVANTQISARPTDQLY